MCLWYDTESWEKLGFFGRVFNVFGIHLLFYLWLGNFVVAVVSYNEIPFSRLIESISISLGGVLNYITLTRLFLRRHQMTKIIRDLDKKFANVPRDTPRFKAWWVTFNKRFIKEGLFVFVFLIYGVFLGLPQFVYMVITGKLYFNSVLSSVSYTPGWWIQVVYQSGNTFYSGINFCIKECTWDEYLLLLGHTVRDAGGYSTGVVDRKGIRPREREAETDRSHSGDERASGVRIIVMQRVNVSGFF